VFSQRVVPPAVVASWQARIEGAAPDVVRIAREEREEAELRRAGMEATRMQASEECAGSVLGELLAGWGGAGWGRPAGTRHIHMRRLLPGVPPMMGGACMQLSQ
jgi:hypothetical protein